MAGRRRTGAAASAISLVSELVLHNMDTQRKHKERAQELAEKLQTEIFMDDYKRGRIVLDPSTGRLVPNPNPPQIPAGMEPTSYDPSTGDTKYGRPLKSSEPDPSVLSGRLASLMSQIQEIEQRNQLAPGMAMADRETAYPTRMFGGYLDNPPNVIQSMMGQKQRPQAPAIQETDTTDLQRAAEALRSRLGYDSQGTPESFLPPRQEGSASQTANRAIMSSGVTPEDVQDLASGVEDGTITSQADAIRIIEAAGLDPNDPAFQSVLSQLP